MKLSTILIAFMILGCTVRKSEPIATSIDTIKDQSIYFTLPLGVTLDQYKSMYRLENYLSDAGPKKIEYVEFDCAIISSPSRDEVANIPPERVAANTTFLEMVDKIIQSYGIRTLSTTAQYVNLKGYKGIWELDLKKNSLALHLKKNSLPFDSTVNSFPEWKVILFKVTKEPIVIPDVLIDASAVESYFEISK